MASTLSESGGVPYPSSPESVSEFDPGDAVRTASELPGNALPLLEAGAVAATIADIGEIKCVGGGGGADAACAGANARTASTIPAPSRSRASSACSSPSRPLKCRSSAVACSVLPGTCFCRCCINAAFSIATLSPFSPCRAAASLLFPAAAGDEEE